MLIKTHAVILPLLIAATCWAQAPEPAAEEPALTPEAIQTRIEEFTTALPGKLDDTVTSEQEAEAMKAAAFYRQAAKQADKLDDDARIALGKLGVMAGLAAGEPEVMASGANLLWSASGEKGPGEAATIMTVWAGIFGGDAKLANKALNRLVNDPPGKAWAGWAKSLKPIADTCNKPVKLSIKLFNGKRATSADLKGRAVVLDFWATWCPPCLDAIPHIRKFHKERKEDKNFVLISLSLDSSAGVAKRGAAKHGMKWHGGMGSTLQRKFGVRGIPHMIVLSADGRMIYRAHPGSMDRIKWATDFARRQARRMKTKAAAKAKARDKKTPAVGTATSSPAATGTATPTASPSAKAPDTPQQQAEKKLRLALVYRDAGMAAKAKEALQAIVSKFPDTPAARKAKAELLK